MKLVTHHVRKEKGRYCWTACGLQLLAVAHSIEDTSRVTCKNCTMTMRFMLADVKQSKESDRRRDCVNGFTE